VPIFPLDSVRNAPIDHGFELLLEDVRAEVAAFPFSPQDVPGDVEDILEVYDLARPRLNVLLSLLRDMEGKIGADIGTGLGFLPVLLARCGIGVVATEQHLPLAHFAAAHGVEVRPYSLGKEAPPFEPASLDFLVLGEVIEHLKLAAASAIRELVPLLRSGGRFLLTTPNIARLQHLQALMAGESFLETFRDDLPPGADPTDYVEHVREYSVREIVEAAESAGLGVEKVLMTGWGEAGYHPLPNPYVNEIAILVATR
jgi:2-polyprenyl-3-methyl-5-hydroxy-6-metoxy-1,4-benzoquinol methylase